jgi:ABC-2 type transport system ATP-binding protein
MVPDQGLLYPLTLAGGRPGGPPASAVPSVTPVPPLVVRGLSVAFGRIRAVDDVDLEVRGGTIVGLVGPNGCGKTTTLRAVLGLVEHKGGSVTVDGVRGGTLAAKARASWVPDEPSGLDELSIDEFLALVAALWGVRDGFAHRAEVLLDAFGLDSRRAVQLGSLSHGQRRLASIVAAVALDRTLLLVDEATAALDPEAVVVLREVLRSTASRGRGVLVATQDLHFAESVCDRVTLLSGGRVAADGLLDELRSHFGASTLEDVFLRALGAADRFEELRSALDAL